MVVLDFDFTDLDDDHTCAAPATAGAEHEGSITAVALGDEPWVATRAPFQLGRASRRLYTVHGEPDPGLALFHAAPNGIACASCHPDGADDGHTWQFVPEGPRRTQSLAGLEIGDTAPFHWDGTLTTFGALFEDVGMGRMGLPAASDTEALLTYMNDFPRPPVVGLPPRPDVAAEGEALFHDPVVGCAECHSGWRYSNGGAADVGTGGTFQVPPLLGVEARLPLMHDGCAATVRQRFEDVECGGGDLHGRTSQLDAHQLDVLIAYLQSL
jgi:hypothetical protein